MADIPTTGRIETQLEHTQVGRANGEVPCSDCGDEPDIDYPRTFTLYAVGNPNSDKPTAYRVESAFCPNCDVRTFESASAPSPKPNKDELLIAASVMDSTLTNPRCVERRAPLEQSAPVIANLEDYRV